MDFTLTIGSMEQNPHKNLIIIFKLGGNHVILDKNLKKGNNAIRFPQTPSRSIRTISQGNDAKNIDMFTSQSQK